MRQIFLGLEEGLDINLYANLDFNAWQMQEIRLGIKDGIDVSAYLNPNINEKR